MQKTLGGPPIWWVVNTDVAHGAVGAADAWLERRIAVVSSAAAHKRFQALRQNDIVLMWESKQGLCAIGRVLGDVRTVRDNLVNAAETQEHHRDVDWFLDFREAPKTYAELQAQVGMNLGIKQPVGRVRKPGPLEAWVRSLIDKPTASRSRLDSLAKVARSLPKRRPSGNAAPPKTMSGVAQFVRCPLVRAWTLDRAQGRCECCGAEAPFMDDEGEAFLESHHVKWLAQGGDDTPENAAAVCPNCHRMLHHGSNRVQLQARLALRIQARDAEYSVQVAEGTASGRARLRLRSLVEPESLTQEAEVA